MITERKILMTAKAHGLTVKGTGVDAVRSILMQMKGLLGQMRNTPIDKVKPLLAKYLSLVQQGASLNKRIASGQNKKIRYDPSQWGWLSSLKKDYVRWMGFFKDDPADKYAQRKWASVCENAMRNADNLSQQLIKS